MVIEVKRKLHFSLLFLLMALFLCTSLIGYSTNNCSCSKEIASSSAIENNHDCCEKQKNETQTFSCISSSDSINPSCRCLSSGNLITYNINEKKISHDFILNQKYDSSNIHIFYENILNLSLDHSLLILPKNNILLHLRSVKPVLL